MTETHKKQGYAFFDLDYTLLAQDSILLFSNFILKREPHRLFYLLILFPAAILASFRIIRSGGLKRAFLSFLSGMKREALEELSRQFVKEEILPRLHPSLIEEISAYQKEGRIVVLNSAAPLFYSRFIAEELNMDHCFATRFQIPDRIPLFLKLEAPNNKRFEKLRAMAPILPEKSANFIKQSPKGKGPDENAYEAFRVPDSISYSDSPADIPLLLLAERGVLINPASEKLLELSKKHSWEIRSLKDPHPGKGSRILASLRQLVGLYPPFF